MSAADGAGLCRVLAARLNTLPFPETNVFGEVRSHTLLIRIRRQKQTAEHLDEAREDILAFAVYPKAVWRQVWSMGGAGNLPPPNDVLVAVKIPLLRRLLYQAGKVLVGLTTMIAIDRRIRPPMMY
ncbi:hypothetical protein [Nonomuraea sp. KM90]|uniref:hypothetical protein n=1 Tax=Nonomuraea sp. KM90 TaxID=3457428 RepID=UPI003FCD188E